MWFGVLGSLEVRDDEGQRLRVGGPLRRVLLAALLCRAPRTVAANLLIEDLWGTLPPRSAAKTLQSHLVRLRDDLGRDAGSVIVTDGAGYRIDLPPTGLDVASFQGALDDGLAAANRDDGRAAILALDAALACWRDEAYLDFGDAPFAVIERMRLAELRALAMETRTDMALRLGEAATLVSELEGRVAREPYRERSWEQLIIALYRSGRQADALTTYRLAHDRLAADLGVDPGPALRALEEQVLQHNPALLADGVREGVPLIDPISSDACPYRGLDGYGPHDASVFVGRERLSAQLVGRLAEAGVVVVTGASGSGKSSLVRAGLIPSLRAGALPSSSGWRVRVATPADCLADDLDLDVLVLDQAEEMFTLLEATDRARLAARLKSFVDAGGRLVLVLRGDFFARLAERPWLAEYAQRSPLLVGPMREDELTRAVTEPARRCGIHVDADVVDAVLEDAIGQAQPLPLISLALVRAWEHRAGNTITLTSYESGGGVAEAIEATAEAVYDAMNPDTRLAARRLLVRLATREGSSWVRRALPRPAGDASSAAVDALVTGRLITVTLNRVELSHDALLERWPRLRDWLDERVAAADLLEHLTAAARAWVAAGRPDSDLYRGLRLQAALDWRHGHPQDLSVDESAFLDTSYAAADSELRKAQARAVAERRGRRRLRWVVAALAAVLVAAVIGALVAVGARSAANRSAGNARQAALSADARRLAALSVSAPDIATSSLLAAAGYRLQNSPDTRGALLSTLVRNQSALFHIATPRRVIRMIGSPDGSRLYAQDNNRTVHVIDPARRAIVTSYPSRSLELVAITGNGSDLVVAGYASGEDPNGGGRVSVLDAADGATRRILTLDAMDGPDVPSMVSGGRWLVTVRAADRTVQRPSATLVVYDATRWARPPRTMELPGPIIDIAAGRRLAAVETADRSVYLVDLDSLAITAHARRTDLPTTTSATAGSPFTIAPDGRHIAYLVPPLDKEPRILDTSDLGGAAQPLPTPRQLTHTLRFNPDGTELVVGSNDGSVNVYSAGDGRSLAALVGHSGPVLATAWGSHNALYTTGLDSQVVSWDVAQTPRLLHPNGPSIDTADHAERFGDQVVGEWPVQGNAAESTERLFDLDLRTGAERSWPAGLSNDDYINQDVATPDGSLALVSIQRYQANVASNRFELWDQRRGILLHTITPPASADESLPLTAAISPDGKTAVVTLRHGELGVLTLPSGRLLRTVTVTFSGPGAERILLDPWQFDPNGNVLVSGSDQGPPDLAPPGQTDPVVTDTSTPNQRLGLLDVATDRLIAQVGMGNVDYPTAVAWSHDRRQIAVGTSAGTLTTYDARTLQPLHQAGIAIAGFVLSASFAADDRTLVTAGTDASMSFWDTATMSREGSRVMTPAATASWWYAWFVPDGSVSGLAPDQSQPTVDHERWFTFPARAQDWVHLACSLAGADITPAQWAQYIGDRPYRHVC